MSSTTTFIKSKRHRYIPNPFHAESLHYNEGEDYYVCPMGQNMNRKVPDVTKQRVDILPKARPERHKDAKAVLCVDVVLKHQGDVP